ncbi:MAG: class I SAM-dependent methyltransferase [Pseudomonadota bacterium]|nr:MAG: hypothetical protein DIU72_10550 [Pseudomonadota bacterium]
MTGASANEQKYESRNPILRMLIARFHRRIAELLAPLRPATILDAGCGEGYLARYLLDHLDGIALWGVDASAAAIERARQRCPEATFEVASLESIDLGRKEFDVVICSEVLEHLEHPEKALVRLSSLCGSHALLTVPWEPWFRLANLARGKYLRNLGNHPEHVQQWTKRGFVRVVEPHFEPLHVEVCFPWTILLGRPRVERRRAAV